MSFHVLSAVRAFSPAKNKFPVFPTLDVLSIGSLKKRIDECCAETDSSLVPAKRDNINFSVYVLVSQFL